MDDGFDLSKMRNRKQYANRLVHPVLETESDEGGITSPPAST
jgi:hypothetical protein